jgi:serine/threonine protein kinase
MMRPFAFAGVRSVLVLHAGTLVGAAGGVAEAVAIKVLPLAGVPPRRMRAARRELAVLCAITHKMAGFAVELRGFCEAGGKLLIVMERADMTLVDWCESFDDGGRLPLREWVRRLLALATAFSLSCVRERMLYLCARCPALALRSDAPIFSHVVWAGIWHCCALCYSQVAVLIALVRCASAAGQLSCVLSVQLDVACQAADALAHLHRLTAVHRDIKPPNLLLGASGTVKLADFGLAQMRQASLRSTAAGGQGTFDYMAPGAPPARWYSAGSGLIHRTRFE